MDDWPVYPEGVEAVVILRVDVDDETSHCAGCGRPIPRGEAVFGSLGDERVWCAACAPDD